MSEIINDELNPEKYKKYKIYVCIPGGSSLCQLYCSLKQVYACFNKFWENYNKYKLPKSN